MAVLRAQSVSVESIYGTSLIDGECLQWSYYTLLGRYHTGLVFDSIHPSVFVGWLLLCNQNLYRQIAGCSVGAGGRGIGC